MYRSVVADFKWAVVTSIRTALWEKIEKTLRPVQTLPAGGKLEKRQYVNFYTNIN